MTPADTPAGPSTGRPSTPGGTTRTDPQQVLEQQAQQIRDIVDGLARSTTGLRWASNLDGRSPCGVPTDSGWPARWPYSQQATGRAAPASAAKGLLDQLRSADWAISDTVSPGGGTRFLATKNDQLVVITAGTGPGVLSITADSACVSQDGDLRSPAQT